MHTHGDCCEEMHACVGVPSAVMSFCFDCLAFVMQHLKGQVLEREELRKAHWVSSAHAQCLCL